MRWAVLAAAALALAACKQPAITAPPGLPPEPAAEEPTARPPYGHLTLKHAPSPAAGNVDDAIADALARLGAATDNLNRVLNHQPRNGKAQP